MYSSGNKLLSGAALAKNERGRIGGPHSVDLVQHLQYSGALANDVVFWFVAISVFAGRKRGDCRCVRGGCHAPVIECVQGFVHVHVFLQLGLAV